MSVDEPAAGGTSLDLGKNNSRDLETRDFDQYEQTVLSSFEKTGETGDGRYDCRVVYANFGYETDDPESDERVPYRCGSWDCYCCGYRMRMNLVEEIKRVCTERPELSRLLTLTLDPELAPDDQEEQHRHITDRWNALRTSITDEFGGFSFIWVREEQASGLPHLHILVSRYLPYEWVSRKWSELGAGEIVDIRKIERVEKAAHYIGKYLTKDALSGLPSGSKRYSSSQDIDLDVRGDRENDDPRQWNLVMDDYQIRDDEPLTRSVTGYDHVEQRENGGPVGKGKDPPND